MSKLEDLFEFGQNTARLAFETEQQVPPFWFIETNAGKRYPLMAPMTDDKDVVAGVIRSALTSLHAVRYCSLLEAWCLEGDSRDECNEILKDLAEVPVREHPDRKEVVYVTAQDKFHVLSGLFYILRPEGEKPHLSEFKKLDYESIEGRFANLLSDGDTIQ